VHVFLADLDMGRGYRLLEQPPEALHRIDMMGLCPVGLIVAGPYSSFPCWTVAMLENRSVPNKLLAVQLIGGETIEAGLQPIQHNRFQASSMRHIGK